MESSSGCCCLWWWIVVTVPGYRTQHLTNWGYFSPWLLPLIRAVLDRLDSRHYGGLLFRCFLRGNRNYQTNGAGQSTALQSLQLGHSLTSTSVIPCCPAAAGGGWGGGGGGGGGCDVRGGATAPGLPDRPGRGPLLLSAPGRAVIGCRHLPPPPPPHPAVTERLEVAGRVPSPSRPRTESRDTELSQHSRGEYILQLS